MDFYLVLGLERAATLGEIKRAYKRLARRYHPDINPGDHMAAQQFRQIAEAYETLSDPERRRHYDTVGVEGPVLEPSAFGFEGFDFSASVSGAAAPTFGDLFADILQPPDPGRVRHAPARGADLHQSMTLTFEEAMRGGERQVVVSRQERCPVCAGAGRQRAPESRCAACRGAGHVKTTRGHMVFARPCAECGGSGRLSDVRCSRCGGSQTVARAETIIAKLAPGLGDGARVRLAGKGHDGRNGGEAGDLYVTVHVEPHPLFRREGDDLHVTVPIAVHEAALGAKLEVPCLDGRARLRVPPGTQSGQRFRIRGRGAPSVRDGGRGDLVVEVRLMLPKVLDERSKELLREFGRINADTMRHDS